MKKIKLNITELFKTIIIYALVFSMLSIAGIYMDARQNAGQSETEEIPWEKRRIIESGGIIPSAIQINPNHLTPLQITVTADSKSVAAVYNPKLVWTIYKDFANIILALFGNYFECEVLNGDIASEYWENCINSADSVYIKYVGEHIYPVISTFLAQSVDSSSIASIDYESAEEKIFAKVHELFIIPEGNEEKFYGVARDKSGNVSVFRLKPINLDDYSDYPNYGTYEISRNKTYREFINRIDFAAYNDTVGVISCKFLQNNKIWEETGFNKNNIKNLELPKDFNLYNDYTYSSVLSWINPISDEYNALEAQSRDNIKGLEIISRILKTFSYNAENVDFYSIEEKGIQGKKFTENHGSLIIFEDGQIFFQYASAETDNSVSNDRGGIHLSNFLGYDTNYYTFYEKIKAASIFVNGLTPEITGSETELYLEDIKFEKNKLTLIFSYYCGGIEIKSGSRNMGVYIVISRNAIVEAGIDTINITSVRTAKNLKQTAVLSYFENELLKSGDDGASLSERELIEYDPKEEKFIIKDLKLIYDTGNIKNMQVAASWVVIQ